MNASSIPLHSTSTMKKINVSLLSTSQFQEEALRILGVSSPLELSRSNSESLKSMYTSVLIVTKDIDFVAYAKTKLITFTMDEYKFTLTGNVLDWRSFFIDSDGHEEILDSIFDLFSKGNNIFKLKKEGGSWKLK